MESTCPKYSGSMELLTNKSMMSDKLLSLASPKPSVALICRQVRVNIPSVGLIWYISICWLLHIYLEYICIREMNNSWKITFVSEIQLLLAFSLVAMLLFTLSAVLSKPHTPVPEHKYQKKTSLKLLISALKCQIYHLQALAALLLINSYLLLQLSEWLAKPKSTTENNGTADVEEFGMNTSNSKTSNWMMIPSVLPGDSFTYLLYCIPVVVPMIVHSVQQSNMVWKTEKLWGFFYSVILLLIGIKYLSSSFSFYVVSLLVAPSPQMLLLKGFPVWIPVVYFTSVLTLFLYSILLKIYVEISCNIPSSGVPATHLTMRKKIRSYPSPLGIIFTTLLIAACEILPMLEIYFQLSNKTEHFIWFLFSFNIAFYLVCLFVLVMVTVRKYLSNNVKAKPRKVGSGVCLADSFVYQCSPNVAKAKYSHAKSLDNILQ
ncbi:uncharacterized protein XB22062450.S [Xenopus laevis]|uniref:Uncharacterized protein n=2 Tax=Xenopus laevis TaxID=8355 RepID=A0A974HRR8_XENLA|nr:uncharacterized protein XB22062450.S [Xenopus laevis]OCT87648.1 hypothetical protein XELAEV_18021345mg [Xenopus laevis]